jgi:hypothetical protein
MNAIEKQESLLKEYGVTNYSIVDNKIVINGSLYLNSLKAADKDFLKDTTINGYLSLNSIQAADKDFLKDTTINGGLSLNSIQAADKDFLKDTTINGGLYLNSLQAADKDFLKDTTINGYLYLDSLKAADKDFLKDTTINGYLYLASLKAADKDFLKDTTINGGLYLNSLKAADKDFLKDTTINGGLSLDSLQAADKDFLKDTTINGGLSLDSLQAADRVILRSNVKQLQRGYNAKKGYCYFDGILTKVTSVSTKNGYTIYTTPIGYVAEKGEYTAHAKSIKEAISDIAYKEMQEQMAKEPLSMESDVNVERYRAITGACKEGVRMWMQSNGVDVESIKVKDLLPLLEKTSAYGVDKFKSLIIQ